MAWAPCAARGSQRGAFVVQYPQPLTRVTVAGHQVADGGPEVGAVVEFLEVGDFVRDDVVDELDREVHQSLVQADDAVGGAAAPAGTRRG